jgi:hypothetical protein
VRSLPGLFEKIVRQPKTTGNRTRVEAQSVFWILAAVFDRPIDEGLAAVDRRHHIETMRAPDHMAAEDEARGPTDQIATKQMVLQCIDSSFRAEEEIQRRSVRHHVAHTLGKFPVAPGVDAIRAGREGDRPQTM